MTTTQMEEVLLEYGGLKEQIKAAQERLAELDEDVRAFVLSQAPLPDAQLDSGTYEVGRYSFSCAMVPGRVTFDKKKLLAENPDISIERYSKVGQPFTKLTVTFN